MKMPFKRASSISFGIDRRAVKKMLSYSAPPGYQPKRSRMSLNDGSGIAVLKASKIGAFL